MSTSSIGNTSLAKCIAAYAAADYTVSLPVGDAAPYDMLVEKDGVVQRVQVKTGKLRKTGCIVFSVRSNNGRWYRKGMIERTYRGKIELFAMYCPQTDTVYALPVEQTGASNVSLRVTEPKNNMRRRIRYAKDFEIQQGDHQ